MNPTFLSATLPPSMVPGVEDQTQGSPQPQPQQMTAKSVLTPQQTPQPRKRTKMKAIPFDQTAFYSPPLSQGKRRNDSNPTSPTNMSNINNQENEPNRSPSKGVIGGKSPSPNKQATPTRNSPGSSPKSSPQNKTTPPTTPGTKVTPPRGNPVGSKQNPSPHSGAATKPPLTRIAPVTVQTPTTIVAEANSTPQNPLFANPLISKGDHPTTGGPTYNHVRISASMQEAPWTKPDHTPDPQQTFHLQASMQQGFNLQNSQWQQQRPQQPQQPIQIPDTFADLQKNVTNLTELQNLSKFHSILINFLLVPNTASELHFLFCMLKMPMDSVVKPVDAYNRYVHSRFYFSYFFPGRLAFSSKLVTVVFSMLVLF